MQLFLTVYTLIGDSIGDKLNQWNAFEEHIQPGTEARFCARLDGLHSTTTDNKLLSIHSNASVHND